MQQVDQVAANWAQVASACALVAGALIAYFTIVSGRKTSRVEASFRYLDRQNGEPIAARIAAARLTWGVRPGEAKDAGVVRLKALDYAADVAFISVLDFYEEVCSVYQQSLLDETIFRNQLAPCVLLYWREAYSVIEYLRTKQTGKPDMSQLDSWEGCYWKLIDANVLYVMSNASLADPPRPPVTKDRRRSGLRGWVGANLWQG
jgi:hypothetical protein